MLTVAPHLQAKPSGESVGRDLRALIEARKRKQSGQEGGEEAGAAGGPKPTQAGLLARRDERKFFDSADFSMMKAGKGNAVDTGMVGSQHPVPENIPHLSSPVGAAHGAPKLDNNGGNPVLHPPHGSMQAGSPVKESSYLHRETSAEEVEGEEGNKKKGEGAAEAGETRAGAIPIRR